MARLQVRHWAGGTGKHGGPQSGTVLVYAPGEEEARRARQAAQDRRPDVERRVLAELADGPAAVWQLAEKLRLPVATVERSLWALRSLGAVDSEQVGSPPVVTWREVRP